MWVKGTGRISVAKRVEGWAGDTGGLGESMPPGALATVGLNPTDRRLRIWAYSREGGDFRYDCPFSEIVPEEGSWSSYPTGRLDTTGIPALTLHGGQLKVLVRCYNGGGSGESPLLRIATDIWYRPS